MLTDPRAFARFGALAIVAAAGLLAACSAGADTIDDVAKSGQFTIGYRPDAAPFSSLGADGKPTGYSVALCTEIAKLVAQAANVKDMKIAYEPVTAESRFMALTTHKIDILCEGTSITIQRMETMDFTLQTFSSGTSLMVRADQNLSDLTQLAGKKVGVLRNTTTAQELKFALEQNKIPADVVEFDTHDAGLAALEAKSIDGYFADRELLMGMKSRAKDSGALKVAQDYLTNEPYALPIRQNDYKLKKIANLALSRAYRSGKIAEIFHAAFPGREPSQLLKALYVLQGVPE
ncbi:MAG TPA: amino acid ABC transporter substrate-binding protein [Dongiaceae bacterium]|nr:amino acid ABC transporter substrate-binding protein [Dongiaceae bacterium]